MIYLYERHVPIALAVALLAFSAGCAHKPPSLKQQVRESLDLFHIGEEQRKAGNLEAAASAYRRSIAVSPRPIAHLRLAEVLIDLGRFDEARDHLNRALEQNPGYPRAQEELIRLQAKITVVDRTGQPRPDRKPLKPFPTAIPAQPGTVSPQAAPTAGGEPLPAAPPSPDVQEKLTALMSQARTALEQGRTQDAIAAYRSCLEIAPDRGEIYYYLGNIYLNSGDVERAYLEYRQAISVNPNLPGAYNNLGVVYEYKGQTEQAIKAYRNAIRVGDHTDAYYNLAVLMEKRGRWEEALRLYRIYLERDSSSVWAEKARKQVRAIERALY